MTSNTTPVESHPKRRLPALFLCSILSILSGCSTSSGGGGGGNPTGPAPPPKPHDPNYKLMTGNWEFTAASTKAAPAFTLLAGFVDEQAGDPSINDFTTAALQAQSSNCFSGIPNISFTGAAQGPQLGLASFVTDSQVVTLNGTKDEAATHLTGTYSISGGCGDGDSGTLTGLLYAPLKGTYSGVVTGTSPAKTIHVTLSQAAQGDGNGRSFVTGTAAFEGISCFSTGTLANPDGFVLGSAASFSFTTGDPNGSQVLMKGSFNAAADTLTLTSITVTGGSCSGALGQATLTLAK